MSYPGRSHGRISTSGFIYQLLKREGRSKKVYHEKSAEVIVLGNWEGLNNLQVFKYTKIIQVNIRMNKEKSTRRILRKYL